MPAAGGVISKFKSRLLKICRNVYVVWRHKMYSNIYEDPDLTVNVRYNKGAREDRGESLERVVDIYESADTFTDHRHVDRSKQGRGEQLLKSVDSMLIMMVEICGCVHSN